jgi:hypothetical protein
MKSVHSEIARVRVRRALLAMALVGVVSKAGVRAEEGAAPGARKPVLELPIEETFQTVVVPVRINKSQVLRCILDTGMPEGVFVMDPAKLKDADIEYSGPVKLNGIGPEAQDGQMAVGTMVRLGDLEFPAQRVIVLDKPGELARIGFDGAIGWSVFSTYVVQMDFDNDVVRLYRPEDFAAMPSETALPLSIAATRPFVEAHVQIDDHAAVPVSLMIDTGASKSLSLNTGPEGGVAPPAQALKSLLSSGVGGDTEGLLGRVAKLRLGSHELQNLVTEFPTKAASDRDGTLGMETLQRFTVAFDCPNKRMYLTPNRRFADPFVHDMSGMALWPDESGRIRVRAVREASPAAAAGVQVGDIVRTIDGQSFSAVQLSQVRDLLKVAGKTVRVELDRDGENFQAELKLKQLI